jgi:predicted RNase H-like nuclease (RuvC/YqgF family)
MWFVTRRRLDAALAEIEGLRRRVLATEARHDEAEGKRRNLARWLAEAEAANKRLTGRVDELRRRVPPGEDVDALHRRIKHLEKQLDDATSVGDVGIPAGEDWRRRPESGAS